MSGNAIWAMGNCVCAVLPGQGLDYARPTSGTFTAAVTVRLVKVRRYCVASKRIAITISG